MSRRWLAVLPLAFAVVTAMAIELTPEEAAGKRLFHSGIGGTGQPVTARVGAQEALVSATLSPCASCHGADGKGRPEAGLRPPDITWRELSKPYGRLRDNGRTRPPLDAASFARAVTEGLDSAGERLDPAMPRFALTRRDADNLLAYLKRIEDDHDPGISPQVLRLGTLLPRQGPLAATAAVVEAVLRAVFAEVNAGGGVHGRLLELEVVDATPAPGPEAVRQAAQAFLAGGDVLALVCPLLPGLDEVAALAEAAQVPVVGPLIADGGLFAGGRYSFSPLPGALEQARVLAEFAARELGPAAPVAIVFAATDAAQALADGAEAQLRRRGWTSVVRQPYAAGASPAATVAALRAAGVQQLFYFGPGRDFAALTRAAAESAWSPTLLALASHAGDLGSLPASFAGRLYLAFPWAPGDVSAAGVQALTALRERQRLPAGAQAVQAAAYASARVLVEGLKRSGKAASRAKLVDALENLYAFETGVAPAIAFGPARRVGVLGAHVVAVDPRTRAMRPAGGFLALEPSL